MGMSKWKALLRRPLTPRRLAGLREATCGRRALPDAQASQHSRGNAVRLRHGPWRAPGRLTHSLGVPACLPKPHHLSR